MQPRINESAGMVRRSASFSPWAEAMLMQSSDGIVIFCAADGAVIDFNDLAAIRLAYSRDELFSLMAADLLVADEPTASAALLAAVATRGAEGAELNLRSKDGTLREVRIRCTPIDDLGHKLVLATLHDLTERRMWERDRIAEQGVARRLAAVRSRLNDAIFHATDTTQALGWALDVVVEELCCDCASLVLLPDDDDSTLEFVIHRAHAGRPSALAKAVPVSLTSQLRSIGADLLAADELIEYDADQLAEKLAPAVLENWPLQSLVLCVLQPHIGHPWALMLAEEAPRRWADEDKAILRDLAPRLEDAITAKLAQDELRQSLRSLETAQGRARIGSWEFDVMKQRGVWSAEMFILYYRDQSLGQPTLEEVLEMVHPDDRANVEAKHDAFIASADERCVMESRTNPRNGPVRIMQNITERELRGERLFLVGTAQDVTEQRQAAELAARLDDLLKQLDVGVFSYSAAGENLEMNDALVRLLDCNSAAEAAQLGYHQVLFGRSESTPAGPPLEPGREREVRVTTAMGHERMLRIATRSLTIAGKIYRIDGIVSDVTGPRMAERRARDAAVAAARVATLTAREREVLDRVVAGEANKVIARGLDLSEKTIEKHRASLMHKTGAKSVAELVRLVLMAQKEPSR